MLKVKSIKVLPIYKFIKDNLSIIILIPAFLGAVYQILNIIFLVGFQYIRYLSVSQLIPDGIIVLVFLAFLIFIGAIVSLFKFNYDEFNPMCIDYGDKKITSILVLILSTAWLFVFIDKISNYEEPNQVIFLFTHYLFTTSITVGILLIILSTHELFAIKYGELGIKIPFTVLTLRKLIYFIAMISFLYLGIDLINRSIIANQIIIQEKNLYNHKKLKEKILKNKDITNISILYSNRDYIFYEVTTKDRKEIAIVELKELLSILQKKDDNED